MAGVARIPGLHVPIVLPANLVGGDPDNEEQLVPHYESIRLTILELENRNVKIDCQRIKAMPDLKSRIKYVRGTTSVPSAQIHQTLRLCEMVTLAIQDRKNEAMPVPTAIAAWVEAQQAR